ncbi:hypothetical protein OPS25_10990 [Alteromonas ponticola]|uniref:Translation initiation factor beta propellor-like domain-containing protein n=1 Tax=Alteromonas aquimaris TaxID=2998417 RepID=A0ABT3P919_9ALTE|nr:hypothetical protein [Alteromonas aquimaris]MCW8109020.1 hypothetical protein [Alteromonas aquimaris]
MFPKALLIFLLVTFIAACSVPESKPDKVWRHAEEAAFAADISPDGRFSVVSSLTQGINVWQYGKEEPIYQWSHQGAGSNVVVSVHISADNQYVATSDREAFALWSMRRGEPVGFWRIDESSVRDIAVANEGKGLLVARSNGKVMYFEPMTGRRLEFLGHQEKVNSVDISPNGKFALSGGNDYVAYLWSTESGQIIHTFTHPSRVTLVAIDDEGRYVFTADSQQKSQIWNAQTGAPVSNLQYIARQKIFTDAVFSKDGKRLLTGAPSRRVYEWDIQTGEQINEWKVAPRENMSPPSAVVYGVGYIDEKHVLTESSSGLAELWSREND